LSTFFFFKDCLRVLQRAKVFLFRNNGKEKQNTKARKQSLKEKKKNGRRKKSIRKKKIYIE